ncbi:MAG: recombinase family protein [Candidatus Pacearchaeota archaeon]
MKCEKCGHESDSNKEILGVFLCNICYKLSPSDENSFEEYLKEKVEGVHLESFRKHFKPGERQLNGMVKKAIKGSIMSRAPFGYRIEKGKLVPAENSKEVEEIFEEFLNENLSLRRIADKHKLSVNGLKKILRNFAYIGKIKFNNQVFEGTHEPIISSTLFNHVQNKLERIGVK